MCSCLKITECLERLVEYSLAYIKAIYFTTDFFSSGKLIFRSFIKFILDYNIQSSEIKQQKDTHSDVQWCK